MDVANKPSLAHPSYYFIRSYPNVQFVIYIKIIE